MLSQRSARHATVLPGHGTVPESFQTTKKTPRSRSEIVRIGLRRFVGTALAIFGLASSGLGAGLGSKSVIFGRILKRFPGPCSSFEKWPAVRTTPRGPHETREIGTGPPRAPGPPRVVAFLTVLARSVQDPTLGFLIHGVLAGQRSSIFGVWAAKKPCIKIPSVR